MRRDVLLLAAICCSLLDRCAARLAHCFREGPLDGGGPQNPLAFGLVEVLTAICGSDQAISFPPSSSSLACAECSCACVDHRSRLASCRSLCRLL